MNVKRTQSTGRCEHCDRDRHKGEYPVLAFVVYNMATNESIGTRTSRALEQIEELIEQGDEERHPNLTLTDACIDLVDTYEGDAGKGELNSLLHDLQVGVEAANEPDQDEGCLVNAANAIIRYFEETVCTKCAYDKLRKARR